MDVLSTFTVLCALLRICESNFAETVNENKENKQLSDEENTSLTGSDVVELMQELTRMLQEVQDRDKETRELVEELLRDKPRVKRSRQKRCRGDLCRDRTTIAPTPTNVYQTERQTESTAATRQGNTAITEKPTTVASTTSISIQVQSVNETTTSTSINISTPSEGTTTSTHPSRTTQSATTTPTDPITMRRTTTTPTDPSTTRRKTTTPTDPSTMRRTTTTPTDPSIMRRTTTTPTDPKTMRNTTQSFDINDNILALTPPSEREVVIPFLTNNGKCFNEHCPQKPFIYVPGRSGMPGAPGERGDRGVRGSEGEHGDLGVPGENGERGPNGPRGDTGFPGVPGMRGDRGIVGPRGGSGLKGVQGQKGEVAEDITTATRTIYTRWGAKDCPRTAEILYEGFAAGAAYNQQGGGTNYLCLPRDPLFNQYRYGVDTWRAYLYGSEYEENNFPPLAGKDDGDVPCAVCLVTDRSVVLMQPARTECPGGWTREYFGYLMASAHIYYRSEWTCVDGNATLVSTQSLTNSDGALFYPTEVCCGNAHTGLPCDLYPNGYELTCSVCSR